MVRRGAALRRRGRIAAILAVGQVLGRGSVAVYTLVVIRRLTASEYGDFAFGLALAGIVAAVADGGMSRLIVRDIARTGEGPGAPTASLLAARLGWTGVVVAAVLVVWATGTLPFDTGAMALLLVFVISEATTLGFESVAVALERPWRITVGQTLQFTVLAAAAAALLAGHSASKAGALAGLAGGSALKLTWHAAVWRTGVHGRFALRGLPLRRWASEAAPFLLLSLLATLYYRVGVIALHAERGAADTAPYAAAFRVVEGLGVAGGVVFSAVAPVLSRAHRDRQDEIWRLWVRLIRLAAIATGTLAVTVAVVAGPAAHLLFGVHYAGHAGTDLRLLSPGIAFLLLQTISASVVFMGDGHEGVIRLTLANVAFCIAATTLLVAVDGGHGAAIATSASELVSFVGFAVLVRRRYGPGSFKR